MGIRHEGEVLLTTEEVGRYLDVTVMTVIRLCERGVLVRRKLPNDRRAFITLESMLSYKKSDKVLLRELATKVHLLEIKLGELLIAKEAATGVTYLDRTDFASSDVDRTIRKHHPNLFKN